MYTSFKLFLTSFYLTLFSVQLSAQADCILGVGVIKDSVLIDVFQLNSLQSENLANFGAEIKYRHEILNNNLTNIKKRHPQGTVSELSKLAEEYSTVMDSMALTQIMIEKRLLGLFNEKQYTLYLNLCREASRSPFIVAPTVYGDTLVVKKRTSFLNNLDDKN